MWPWGHLAVGYLAYAVALDRRLRRPPGAAAVVLLAVATQLPDVVDKTLGWYLGVIPNGRALAHSVLVAALAVALVGAYLRSRERGGLALAFGVGYVAHLAADAFQPAVEGRWADLAFLAAPLLPQAEEPGAAGILERFAALAGQLAAGEVPPFLALEFGLVLLAAALWVAHGAPGLRRVRSSPPE